MAEFTKGVFWAATAERALKAFCAALLAILGSGAFDILTVPWPKALTTAAGAAVISVLFSITSSTVTGGGPSLTNTERLSND